MEIKAKCTVRGVQNYWHLTPQERSDYLQFSTFTTKLLAFNSPRAKRLPPFNFI